METQADVALQYIRGDLATLRDEIAGVRGDVSDIATEIRGYAAEWGPMLAVLSHRVGESEKNLDQMRTEQTEKDAQQTTRTWALWVSVIGALVTALLSAGSQIIVGS